MCIECQYCKVVTLLEICFVVCSPTYFAIMHCVLKMIERADIPSYICTKTQAVQNDSKLWTLLLENETGMFPCLIWLWNKETRQCCQLNKNVTSCFLLHWWLIMDLFWYCDPGNRSYCLNNVVLTKGHCLCGCHLCTFLI